MAFAPEQALALIRQAHENDRLAHAFLVSGPEMADHLPHRIDLDPADFRFRLQDHRPVFPQVIQRGNAAPAIHQTSRADSHRVQIRHLRSTN